MSPCTKRLQRSTRSLAPFSGLKVSPCACVSGVKSAVPVPSVAAAATPAEPSRNLRRLNVVMVSPCCLDGLGQGSGGEPRAAGGVEQVGALQVGNQVDGAARRERMALAKDDEHIRFAAPARHQRVGAGG